MASDNDHLAACDADGDGAARYAKLRAVLAGENYSDADKRFIRRAHADANQRALAALEDAQGMARFLETRELNPKLTPLAQARVAMDAPGRVVDSFAGWNKAGHRIRKGEHAVSYATKAPHMWPLPLFAAEQTDYPEEYVDSQLEEVGSPDSGLVAAAIESLRGFYADLGMKTKALNAWNETALI